jgi:hypothetical protein
MDLWVFMSTNYILRCSISYYVVVYCSILQSLYIRTSCIDFYSQSIYS